MQRWIFNFVETSFLWLLPSGVTTANHLPSSNPIVWKQQSANQLKLRHLASQLSCTLQIELHHGHNILYMWTKYLIVATHRYSIRCTQNTFISFHDATKQSCAGTVMVTILYIFPQLRHKHTRGYFRMKWPVKETVFLLISSWMSTEPGHDQVR